jgi:hypothetical protein
MRLARVVTAVVAALLPLLATTQAEAIDRTTPYYTIRIMPADAASPHLFLTHTSGGLRLERYRSGDLSQMWTVTQPDYPTGFGTAPFGTVEGQFAECFDTSSSSDAAASCDFRAHAGAEYRLINRLTGQCITVGATRAVGSACSNTGNNPTWQRLGSVITFADQVAIKMPFMTIQNKNGRCLGANRDDPARLLADNCGGNTTQFTAQPVAEASCKVDWEWELCF